MKKIKGWCRYFPLKRGGRYYDMDTFARSRQRSKELWSESLEYASPTTKEKWLKEATYCKVTVTVEPR